MTGAPAAVGDDGARPLHHRFPVGVGHVGDQHVAESHPVHLGGGVDHPHRPDTDLLADGAAMGQGLAILLEAVLLHDVAGLLALHRFRTGLEDVELAVVAALAPLDVHRAAIVLLDDHGVTGQLQHVLVGQGELHPVGLGHIHRPGGTASFLLLGEDHLDQLGAEVAADHRRLALCQGGLVYIELVGVHRALHDRFAQAIGGGDEDHVLETGFGIDGEHHSRSADVRAHHALHPGGERHLGVGEALVHAVGDGPVVVEGGKHLLHGVEDVLVAVDIQEGLLLAGEGGVGQILGGGGGTHGEAALALRGDLVVGGFDLRFEPGREGRVHDPLTDLRAGLQEGIHVVYIEPVQGGIDTVGQPFVGQECAIGLGGGGKATRDAHAGGQLADHLTEAGVLTAHLLDVSHAQFFKGNHKTGHGGSLPDLVECWRENLKIAQNASLSRCLLRRISGFVLIRPSLPWPHRLPGQSFSSPMAPALPPKPWATACWPNSRIAASARCGCPSWIAWTRPLTAPPRSGRWGARTVCAPSSSTPWWTPRRWPASVRPTPCSWIFSKSSSSPWRANWASAPPTPSAVFMAWPTASTTPPASRPSTSPWPTTMAFPMPNWPRPM